MPTASDSLLLFALGLFNVLVAILIAGVRGWSERVHEYDLRPNDVDPPEGQPA